MIGYVTKSTHFAQKRFIKNNQFEANNGTQAPEYYIYTELDNNIQINLNSVHASDVLDHPRDVLMFIILMFCFMWILLVIDYFEDPEIGWDAVNYLIITLFFIGAYYLWVFVLSVVPVFFCLPMYMTNVDYYKESLYSLTFVVGDYDPIWWVAGVLVNGLWAYSLVLFVPALGAVYLIVAILCCCDDERTDSWGACIIIPVLLVSICIIIVFTFSYYAIFIGNLVYWNSKTFKDMSDENVIQAVSAICVFFFLLPVMGLVLAATTRWNKKCEKETKRKGMNRVGSSMQIIPLVRNRVSAQKRSYSKVKTTATDNVNKEEAEMQKVRVEDSK